jgi:hypothetical protein
VLDQNLVEANASPPSRRLCSRVHFWPCHSGHQ